MFNKLRVFAGSPNPYSHNICKHVNHSLPYPPPRENSQHIEQAGNNSFDFMSFVRPYFWSWNIELSVVFGKYCNAISFKPILLIK